MTARTSEDADPIKNPSKHPKARETLSTLPNRRNPRRRSPRKAAAPPSSVRNTKTETIPLGQGRVSQDNSGDELRGRPTADFDPQVRRKAYMTLPWLTPETDFTRLGRYAYQTLLQSYTIEYRRLVVASSYFHTYQSRRQDHHTLRIHANSRRMKLCHTHNLNI
jgi:hypothetical protein